MILDYDKGKLLIFTEGRESILDMGESSNYKLVHSYDLTNSCYMMPFVALPIILDAAKKLNYPVTLEPTLKEQYKNFKAKRNLLEEIKNGKRPSDQLSIEVIEFCKSLEAKHNFKYYDLQLDSILFGVHGNRICIGNEIGTGKTLTSVSIIKFLIHKNLISKCLIFVPASLVNNFYNDYVRFFGKDGIVSVREQPKEQRIRIYNSFQSNPNFNFLILNYEKCLFDDTELKKLKVDAVIVDEFHRMKNFVSAKRSINFFDNIANNWKPKVRIPMSGTPIENRLFDLFPVFKFMDGGFILGGQSFFENNFIEYETKTFMAKGKGGGKYLRTETLPVGFKNHTYLKNLIRPFIIRKKLSLNVGLIKENIYFDLSKKLKEKYQEIIFDNKTNPSARYHALRQFLCDVKRMGLSDSDNPKLEELKNIIEQTDSKVVVFSFYKCSIRTISEYLDSLKIGNLRITGDESDDPVKVIEEFASSDKQVLLCTDKVNFGLNIQCANVIVQYELPLKPSTSQQRIGRLYRTGQQKDVLSINFVVKNTVEETIHEVFKEKENVIQTIIENLDEKTELKIQEEINQRILKSIGFPNEKKLIGEY